MISNDIEYINELESIISGGFLVLNTDISIDGKFDKIKNVLSSICFNFIPSFYGYGEHGEGKIIIDLYDKLENTYIKDTIEIIDLNKQYFTYKEYIDSMYKEIISMDSFNVDDLKTVLSIAEERDSSFVSGLFSDDKKIQESCKEAMSNIETLIDIREFVYNQRDSLEALKTSSTCPDRKMFSDFSTVYMKSILNFILYSVVTVLTTFHDISSIVYDKHDVNNDDNFILL